MKRFFILAASLVACALAHAQFSFDLQGQVAYVDDGDTIILHPNKERIRLAEIDAPETEHGASRSGQPYGQNARAALVAMMPIGSEVTARCYDRDAHGRAVCRIFYNKIDISLEMVRLGHAHAYKEYVRDPRIIGSAEHAKTAQIGLWASSDAVYPQTWRRSCWDKTDTPLFCSVPDTMSAPSAQRVAKQTTAPHPQTTDEPTTPMAGKFGVKDALDYLQSLKRLLATIKWP